MNSATSNRRFDVLGAALRGKWDAIISFYNFQQMEPLSDIDSEGDNTNVLVSSVSGDTILHMCALCCQTDIMNQLLRIMPAAKRLLSVPNRKGNTVLHEAARTGIVEMAMLILKKEVDGGGDQVLISVSNLNGETPIYWAAMYGHKDMLLFLNITATSRRITSKFTSPSMVGPLTMRTDGSTILHAAVLAEFYDIALEIMEIYPDLASGRNGDGAMASHLLALSPSSFKSGTMYSRQYLGTTLFVLATKGSPSRAMGHMIDYNQSPHVRKSSGITSDGYVEHSYALQLLWKLLEKDYGQWTMTYDDPPLQYQHPSTINNKVLERPIILATKLGIIEMLKEIIEMYPESIEVTDEEAGRNLLHLAAEYRHESIINFLKSSSTNSKRNLDMLVVGIDKDGNSPLHAAAKLGTHKPWHIRGAAQWMQWECVWFQRVKRLLPPHMLIMKNCNNQYAYQVFTETHRDLRVEGERWLKEASNICMFISALIATVMFASAFTLPGGNDSHSGRPVLLKNQDFVPFLHYVGLSLFFSLISLGMFFSIHTAPFEEHEFFLRLPLRVVFAATAFVNSVTFTVCAFFQTWMLISGWTFPLGLLCFDIGLASVGVVFIAELFPDIIVGFISYLLDILFI
ncbi:ankyrin repeat-containing protein At5g02620-like isoform X2 [Papaver somniferum]|uniref:ankyrin repeat-containing protein At5g02620-like isoform X2 n=1 Tax=Papaver somniferum TaxID=3469 RepID=UPI000E6FFD6E|nr:ankyrin repeat-containing protein At5g02620-like isoform X2 [Papaver somniferum]